ncbi:uncharacterized protein LOC102807106, partial [Saccoglossus kowalevskii]|uniref:Uncharacterized protein LOC102807106 n=1 Tax=Saccoglossus kowalevskii TaxID=10224 RepID=A0ABM0MA29_SACKO
GVYIESLVNKKKQFRSDETFIAHIHSVLLQLASKSYLYYHSYCLNSTSNKDAQFSSTNHQAGKKTMASFLGVTDGDADIVKYWVELIKQQQVDDFIARINGYSNHDQLPSPPVRIDFRQSREYAV